MDVVTVKANHINSFLQYQQQTLQYQLDSKLIAFYTILTVALSVILLSFKQSRILLTHTAPIITQYPYVFNNNLKKCFKCLKCKLNAVDRYQILNLRTSLRNKRNNLAYYSKYCLSSCTQNNIKYLKLKRLRNIAAASLAVTKFTCNNYLFKTINTTLLKMKRTTFRLKKKFSKTSCQNYALRKCDVNSYSVSDMYVANKNADMYDTNNNNSDDTDSGYDDSSTKTTKFLNTCQSYPIFNNHVHNNKSEVNNQETRSLRRSKSLPKINSRVS
jgi:hypothetical protein